MKLSGKYEKIWMLSYCDILVRFFSTKSKALEFRDICCKNDSSLDPSDYYACEMDIDNMEM